VKRLERHKQLSELSDSLDRDKKARREKLLSFFGSMTSRRNIPFNVPREPENIVCGNYGSIEQFS
jgi:hypothetical protein